MFTAFHLPFAAFARGSVPAVQPEYNTMEFRKKLGFYKDSSHNGWTGEHFSLIMQVKGVVVFLRSSIVCLPCFYFYFYFILNGFDQ